MEEHTEFNPSYPEQAGELSSEPAYPRKKFRWGCLGLVLLIILISAGVFVLIGPTLVARSGEAIAFDPAAKQATVPVVDLQLIIWPDRIELQNNNADSLWSFSRSDAAMQLTYLALQLWPQSADLHNTLGQVYFTKNLPDWAISQFEAALNLDDNLATVYNNLGVTLIELDKPIEAVPHLQKAILLDPGNSAAMVNLGSAYLKAGKIDKALQIIQQVVAQDPENSSSWILLGRIYLNQADFKAAEQSFDKAMEYKPSSHLAQQGKGITALQKGDASIAAGYLKAALKGDAGDALTHLYLGIALETLGQTDQAALAFEHALDLTMDPTIINMAKDHLKALSQTTQSSSDS